MPQGLQIWDPNGVPILDTNYDTARILNCFFINPGSGSINDARISSGRPFHTYQINFDGSTAAFWGGGALNAYFSGNSLIWTLTGDYGVYISYGVY